MKKVLITGILGQDGASMAEYLLSEKEDCLVYGMMRRSANPNFVNIETFKDRERFELVCGDLTDEVSINELVKKIKPDYLVNFAANSFVGCSWDMPVHMFDVNTLGVIRCLEAIRNYAPECRFYSAGSSEQFGNVDYSPQDMKHPFKPRSPYGASKCAASHVVKVYRESYNMYAVHGVLFNHEGIKRAEQFVTRKITIGVARIQSAIHNAQDFEPIELGNLDAQRDWSDSEDFVKGVWLMLNQDNPKDYLLASGEMHSIREFVEKAFTHAGLEGVWIGEGLDERYVYKKDERELVLVKINPEFYRPAEVEELMGDASEIAEDLNWTPDGNFSTLVQKMVDHDVELQRKIKD
tara:strand:+ start:102 stop:1154 length:1053 start_codon:yes stop_codon:yes gene_type:complete